MKWLTQWAITSSVLILIVLAARYLLRDKLSARWRYALWAVVLVRLLIPFQVEIPANVSSSLPLLASNLAPEVADVELYALRTSSRPMPEENLQELRDIGRKTGDVLFYEKDYLTTIAGHDLESNTHCYVLSNKGIDRYFFYATLPQFLTALWAIGAVVTLRTVLRSNRYFLGRLKYYRRALEDVNVPIPVYTAANVSSPCLFGVLRPAVYVTSETAENPDTLRHVLAHELTHYAHKDHIWSLLRCLALALHWYNPLVWLAVVLSKRDGELACDEGAVAQLGEEERIPYGRTLVDMVARRSLRPADLLSCSTAMTGGGKSIQNRVTRLVKKPETVKTALFAAAAVVALSVVFVFAARPADLTLKQYLALVEEAESIRYFPPLTSSIFYPSPITDSDLLDAARKCLSDAVPLEADDPQPVGTHLLNAPRITLTAGTKETTFTLLWEGSRTYIYEGVFDWSTAYLSSVDSSQNMKLRFVSKQDTDSILESLARQQNHRDIPSAFDQYLIQVENAAALYYYSRNPYHADESYPNPIADEDLLPNAKAQLSDFISMDQLPDSPVPTPKWAEHADQVAICPTLDKSGSQTYRLFLYNGYTYLLPLEDNTILARSAKPYDVAKFIRTLAQTEYNRSL